MSDIINRFWPTCARCNKPVDKMLSYYEQYECRTVLVACCHGEREKVELEDELVLTAHDMRGGVAFKTPLLTGVTLALPEGEP